MTNSPLFALRACMLRSHRIKANATTNAMHKPSGFKGLSFIFYFRMWLHKGVPVDHSRQQGYGRCCGMTGGDSRIPGSTHVPDKGADSTRDAGPRKTRAQAFGAGSSGATQSITAAIDHMSLATAM